MHILNKYLYWVQNRINRKNQKRLVNKNITLICSNCTGGVLYHWLNLKFQSPFINLYMDNKDFITALENFDEFLTEDIVEDLNSQKSYPVGIGCHGERIHFMHYKDFPSALEKWNIRKKRINRNNIAVMLTNFGAGLTDQEIQECTNNRELGRGGGNNY